MYISRSIMMPNIWMGDSFGFIRSNLRRGYGIPISMVMFAFPDSIELYGNFAIAIKMTRRKMIPRIAPVFFVGTNSLGTTLLRKSVSVSFFPTYLYSGERS